MKIVNLFINDEYLKDLQDYENSFYCNSCGYENGKEGWVYNRTVANGDCWFCPSCKTEIVHQEEPNEDNY